MMTGLVKIYLSDNYNYQKNNRQELWYKSEYKTDLLYVKKCTKSKSNWGIYSKHEGKSRGNKFSINYSFVQNI